MLWICRWGNIMASNESQFRLVYIDKSGMRRTIVLQAKSKLEARKVVRNLKRFERFAIEK